MWVCVFVLSYLGRRSKKSIGCVGIWGQKQLLLAAVHPTPLTESAAVAAAVTEKLWENTFADMRTPPQKVVAMLLTMSSTHKVLVPNYSSVLLAWLPAEHIYRAVAAGAGQKWSRQLRRKGICLTVGIDKWPPLHQVSTDILSDPWEETELVHPISKTSLSLYKSTWNILSRRNILSFLSKENLGRICFLKLGINFEIFLVLFLTWIKCSLFHCNVHFMLTTAAAAGNEAWKEGRLHSMLNWEPLVAKPGLLQ